MEIAVQGPLWHSILQAATLQIMKLHEENDARDFLKEMMPLVALRRHQTFQKTGNSQMSETLFT